MAFEEVEFIGPAPIDAVPNGGIRVKPRTFKSKHGVKHWIEITIGEHLSRKICLSKPKHGMRVLFGTGEDAGKIAVAVDDEKGRFSAKKAKSSGRYVLSIGAASAEGLFALEFPVFAVLDPLVFCKDGSPPSFTFAASAEMLAIED